MNVLKIFLLGFGLWYGIQIFDLLISLVKSYINVFISKNNIKINNMSTDESIGNVNSVGFQYQPDVEYYEEENGDKI